MLLLSYFGYFDTFSQRQAAKAKAQMIMPIGTGSSELSQLTNPK